MAGVNFIGFLIFAWLAKEIFYFDEEFLVVCSFFLVFGALVNASSGMVTAELDSRINILQAQILSIYRLRTEILKSLVNSYKLRQSVNSTMISAILFGFLLLRGRLLNSIETSSNFIIESFIKSLNETIELETSVIKEFFGKHVEQTSISDNSDRSFFDHCFVSLQTY